VETAWCNSELSINDDDRAFVCGGNASHCPEWSCGKVLYNALGSP
jgi:hypothetical protein